MLKRPRALIISAFVGLAAPPATSAEPATAVPAASSAEQCAAVATRIPTQLSTSYVGQLLNPHEVQVVATLPSVGRGCASVGRRVFVLKDIELQQEHKVTLGFGSGPQIWKAAMRRPLTLTSGNGERKLSHRVTVTLQLYCYGTASKTDGVNRARAVYLLEFEPRDPADKPTIRILTRIVHYGLGYC